MYELIAICDARKQADGEGSLWVDMAEIDRCSTTPARSEISAVTPVQPRWKRACTLSRLVLSPPC
jgi:hypothetical protein